MDAEPNSAGYAQFLSQDAERALRLCALAWGLSEAHQGLSNQQIYDAYYSFVDRDVAKRSWQRDRKRLIQLGVGLVYEHRRWRVQNSKGLNSLGEKDRAQVQAALGLSLSDEDVPFASELAFAELKLADKRSGELQKLPYRRSVVAPQTKLPELLEAWAKYQEVEVSYTNKSGEARRRTLHIYGFFGNGAYTYVVALDTTNKTCKTYRTDRFTKVTPHAQTHYEIPNDFDIRAWSWLPFQLGKKQVVALFEAGPASSQDSISTFEPYGHITAEGTLELAVADIPAAARWAIVEDLVPQDPPELVGTWRSILLTNCR